MGSTVLLLDRDTAASRHVSRVWTVFGSRNGLHAPVERLRLASPDAEVVYFHPDAAYERYAAAMLGAAPFRSLHPEHLALRYLAGETDEIASIFEGILDSAEYAAGRLLDDLGGRIVDDIAAAAARGGFVAMAQPGDGVHVVGRPSAVYLHPDAALYPGTVLDTRDGPIAIDARASVGQFSYIAGPAYVGPDARVDNCRLLGPVAIGRHCRVGGEIECSILGDFSNKHHEGFLGHSIVGRWVNLGALVTTSDLKNNYGEVRLSVPTDFLAGRGGEPVPVPLGRIKFGSVVGDCVKIAIGTCLNTGTVIDVGCNVFAGDPPKYLPPFAWGPSGARYRLDRFLKDCGTIFARRQQTVDAAFRDMAGYLWRATGDAGPEAAR